MLAQVHRMCIHYAMFTPHKLLSKKNDDARRVYFTRFGQGEILAVQKKKSGWRVAFKCLYVTLGALTENRQSPSLGTRTPKPCPHWDRAVRGSEQQPMAFEEPLGATSSYSYLFYLKKKFENELRGEAICIIRVRAQRPNREMEWLCID